MRSAILGFAAGVFWLQNQAELPAVWAMALILSGAVLAGMLAHRVRGSAARIPLLFISGCAFGFVWAALLAQHALSEQLPADWEGRDVTVIGTIDSLPQRSEQGLRFNFAVERVLAQGGEAPVLPTRVTLSWYASLAGDGERVERTVEPGERWQLTVRLQRPHGNANPHGFDYEVWLLEQGVRATGYVRPERDGMPPNRRVDAFAWSVGNVVEACRGYLRQRILAALPERNYAGVIVALVVGDQRAVSLVNDNKVLFLWVFDCKGFFGNRRKSMQLKFWLRFAPVFRRMTLKFWSDRDGMRCTCLRARTLPEPSTGLGSEVP